MSHVREVRLNDSRWAKFFGLTKYICDKHPEGRVEQNGIMRGICVECWREAIQTHRAAERAARIAEMREAFVQAFPAIDLREAVATHEEGDTYVRVKPQKA